MPSFIMRAIWRQRSKPCGIVILCRYAAFCGTHTSSNNPEAEAAEGVILKYTFAQTRVSPPSALANDVNQASCGLYIADIYGKQGYSFTEDAVRLTVPAYPRLDSLHSSDVPMSSHAGCPHHLL